MRLKSTWTKFLYRKKKTVTAEQSMQCPMNTGGSFDEAKEGGA